MGDLLIPKTNGHVTGNGLAADFIFSCFCSKSKVLGHIDLVAMLQQSKQAGTLNIPDFRLRKKPIAVT